MTYEFDSYIEGGKNREGKVIEEIYVREEGKYIVYKCKNLKSINFDGKSEISENMYKISPKLSNVEILLSAKGINEKLFNEQMVYSYVLAASGEMELAEKILDQIEKKIINIKSTSGRSHYLLGAVTIMLISIIVASISTLNNEYLIEKQFNDLKIISYVMMAGSLGGFLSMALKINSLDIESDSGFWTNYIAGMMRIMISISCSIIVFLVIKSNLALGFIEHSNNYDYILTTFSVVSGFSETFIPNIINKIESNGLEA